ncbi:tripartite tricarboxylate transporter TctB family protein [Aureimonas sp. AU22]|uniref:tripartite tricarboxylate transporter TctB family protein n=1 Tax=Aureimonas sp. AU22 TaxID=1638162 RepID=UPI000782C164|nr:tripartite tricarboxylate transporter TctB family protein [Aureimonas sp. AU22]
MTTTADRIGGLALAGLGAATITAAAQLPSVPGQPIGPAVFPYVIGAGLCLCALLILFSAGVSEEEEPVDLARSRGATLLRLALPSLLLVFYVYSVETLGFLLSGFVVVLAASLLLGARPLVALPLAVVMPALIHTIFSSLLRVPLPAGLLTLPW